MWWVCMSTTNECILEPWRQTVGLIWLCLVYQLHFSMWSGSLNLEQWTGEHHRCSFRHTLRDPLQSASAFLTQGWHYHSYIGLIHCIHHAGSSHSKEYSTWCPRLQGLRAILGKYLSSNKACRICGLKFTPIWFPFMESKKLSYAILSALRSALHIVTILVLLVLQMIRCHALVSVHDLNCT